MRLPQRKKPGDPILAEDWNLLLESIAARTPRPGSGLELIASTGGFYYSARTPKHIQQPGHPPFSVIGIARAGGAYTITLKEGWVIERTPKPSADSAVKFHMPKASGIPLDTVPRPEIAIAIGNTVWCRVKTDTAGVITDPPEIIVSSSDMPGEHYQPENPEDNGTEGTHYIKLLRLDDDGTGPVVKVYQQSDIEHWAQLWTGANTGYASRVFKKHNKNEGTYEFRSIKGESPVIVKEDGDEIVVSLDPDFPDDDPPEYAQTGELVFIDCADIEFAKVAWQDGLVKTAGRITVRIPPCLDPGDDGDDDDDDDDDDDEITGATGTLTIRTDNPAFIYPDNIVGFVKVENGIVKEIWGDVTFCCHPDLP